MAEGISRRQFLKLSSGAMSGVAAAEMAGFGFDAAPVRARATASPIKQGKEVPGVCPYCAVGCGQIVWVREGKIVNIEGHPDSPINRGTLCPKGAATYQLAVNPNRVTRVWYRAPGAKDWDKTKTLDWAMEQIAQRVKATRDATFRETAERDLDGNPLRDSKGNPTTKRVNHTLAIGSLGGATMDNEWNYLQCKLMRGLGVVFIENQARI